MLFRPGSGNAGAPCQPISKCVSDAALPHLHEAATPRAARTARDCAKPSSIRPPRPARLALRCGRNSAPTWRDYLRAAIPLLPLAASDNASIMGSRLLLIERQVVHQLESMACNKSSPYRRASGLATLSQLPISPTSALASLLSWWTSMAGCCGGS